MRAQTLRNRGVEFNAATGQHQSHKLDDLSVRKYGQRHIVEILFAVLKNLLGAFRFRFWTPYLPRHARRPTPNRALQAPAPEHQATVATCWQAYEVFVCCALIAQGLLQLIALRFGPEVWQQHQLYLRTRSRALPSEQTVRQVLAALLLQQLRDLPPSSLIAQIHRLFHGIEEEEPADPAVGT